jgi:uncharacterized protein (DUF433 family)
MITPLVTIDPTVMSGALCFTGTRVPVKTLFDYLEGKSSLEDFLDDFPTVSREVASHCWRTLGSACWAMRLLLDESVPRKLRFALANHDVRTAVEMGWSGRRNGEPLSLAAVDFDVFVTVDKNLP